MLPVLIYADRWAVSYALEALCRQECPDRPVLRCDSLPVLSHMLQVQPQAPLILGLSAHEQVFLLYAIHPLLNERRVLMVADRVYYSDRILLECLGVSGIVRTRRLLPLLSSPPQGGHLLSVFLSSADIELMTVMPARIWGPVDDGDELLLLMTSLMTYRLGLAGLNNNELKVLLGVMAGQSIATLAGLMGRCGRMVSCYKVSALRKLGMENHPDMVMRSGPPQACLQRTPFMTQADFMTLGEHSPPPRRKRSAVTDNRVREGGSDIQVSWSEPAWPERNRKA